MLYQSKQGQMYYEVHGNKNAPSVLFTHGVGLNHKYFNSQVTALKKGYQVVTWDLEGHGRSTPLDRNLNVQKMADCLIGIMDELKIDKAVLVGHSLGSWIIQLAAINYPKRVKALVSISGQPVENPLNKMEMLMYKAMLFTSKFVPFNRLCRWVARNKATTHDAQQFAEQSMKEIGKKQFFLIVAGMLDAGNLGVTKQPVQPLLITHGKHEMPKSVIESCKKWHSLLPNSHYYEIPKAGHNGNQDNPEDFNKVLKHFLKIHCF